MNVRWNPRKSSQRATITRFTTKLTAEDVDEVMQYEADHKVLICREHGYGIQNFHDHLRDQHTTSVKDRRAIIEKYAQCELLEPAQVEPPPPLRPSIPALGKPIEAFLCEGEECGYISINDSVIRKHCNKKHDWKSTKEDPEHWRKVKVQTFFKGRFTRYFVVNGAEDQPVNLLLNGEQEDEAAAIKREWREAREKRKRELEVADEKIAKTDRTGWFNRTGWPEHLARRNLKRLAHASRPPDRDERLLQQAVRVVDLAIEQSVAGLSTLALETRRWLRSAKREEVDVRPMARLQNPESQSRYAGYIKRFVCYVLRLVVTGEELEGDEEGRGDSEGEDEEDGSEGEEEEEEGEDDGEDGEDGADDDPLSDARKLFIWQGEQKELAKELWRSLELDGEETQVENLLQLLGSFVFHTVGDRPFNSGLVHFLAVLGIDEEMNRLRTGDNYSYMLAGVVYCVRVLAAEVLLPSAKRDEQGEAERKHFLRMRRRFLADGSYSPMSTMISLLAYGKSIALNASNAGSVHWSPDRRVLYLHGRPIVIERFRKMVRDVAQEAERVLWEELMWTGPEGRLVVPLDKIVDDVTFTRRGISFVSKSGNGLADGLDRMIDRMLTSEEGRKMRVNGIWNVRQIRRYLRKVDRFLELLLFSAHTTAGQPARGTEITTVRHQNGFLQDRNIFVIDGRVVIITRYHKSQSQFDTPKIIPRFLPWRVGQLMAVYSGYVRPFREHLMVQLQGKGWSDHVWADANGPWETDRLTSIITRETASRVGERLTTLDYRHTAISIGRVFVGEPFASGYREEVGEVEEPQVEVEDALELHAGRGEKMGVQRYGVPSDVVKHLSIRSMETFRPLSEAWHRFLGLSSDEAGEQGMKKQGSEPVRWDKKRARDDPSMLCIRSAPPKLARACEKVAAANQAVHKGVGTAEVNRAMQRALGRDDVSFRSKEQELAMEAILAGQTPLVVVLPTGGGKSLLFMAPACLDEPGVTIVVAPFRALVDDLADRLKQSGIDCLEWRPGEVNPAAVVVVSADFAARWDFLDYASLLNRQGLLRRVVIDECHLTFTSSDYRPKLARLKQLRALTCPMILLTATLPPLLENELSESMLVRCARYIRAVTVRKNVRYMVQWCRGGELAETAMDVCRRQASKLVGRKGVVYCRSRARCEELAEQLGCGHYHAGSVDKEERLQDWLEKGGLMVATSALGTGVDYPGIVFVLHVGMPYGMIDFAQESGRAGRAGEAVDSIVLVQDGETRRKGDGERTIDESAMAAFVEADGCRRGVMSRYLDGQETECSQMDMALCDRCGEGVREWQMSQVEAEEEWRQVREVLDELADGCAACWITQEGEDAHLHSLKRCQRKADLSQAACDEFRRKISYEGRSHSCTRCGVSQKFCATGVGEGIRCQWPNVLVPIVRAAMGNPVGAEILARVGWKGEYRDWVGYGRWLGRRHERRFWGEWMSNAMVVLIEMVLYIVGRSR